MYFILYYFRGQYQAYLAVGKQIAENIPLVKVTDVIQYMPQISYMMRASNSQESSTGPPANKRACISQESGWGAYDKCSQQTTLSSNNSASTLEPTKASSSSASSTNTTSSASSSALTKAALDYSFSDLWQQMSHGLLLKKKEQHLQHQFMLQQQLQQPSNPFPSPITPTYEKKASTSCRFDVSGNGRSSREGANSSNQSHNTEVSSSTSTSNRHSFSQFPFNELSYGTASNSSSSYSSPFLSSNYSAAVSAAALGHHESSARSSCSALPSPTIYPPTPPPSTLGIHHPIHPSWFGADTF